MKMNLPRAFAVMLLAAAAASAAGDCILDLSGLAPILAHSKPERRDRELIERAALPGGVRLEVRQGGCAHYGKRYTWTNVKDSAALEDRKHYFNAAAALLRQKLRPKADPLDADLAGYLESAAGGVESWGACSAERCATDFSCGDATCGIEVTLSKRGRVTISAVYDFPL
jgi:hypothetical protein